MSNMANMNRYKSQKQKLFEIFNNLLRVLNVPETKICHDSSSITAMSPSWFIKLPPVYKHSGLFADRLTAHFFLLHLIDPFFTSAVYEV